MIETKDISDRQLALLADLNNSAVGDNLFSVLYAQRAGLVNILTSSRDLIAIHQAQGAIQFLDSLVTETKRADDILSRRLLAQRQK